MHLRFLVFLGISIISFIFNVKSEKGLNSSIEQECDNDIVIELIRLLREQHKRLYYIMRDMVAFYESLKTKNLKPLCPPPYPNEAKSIRLPSSCAEALEYYTEEKEELLGIPNNPIMPFYAYCANDTLQSGRAWTVIMQRMNGEFSFDREWDFYKYGFGSLRGDHWLGLEKIYHLTNLRPHELWIQVDKFHARYDDFQIGNEQTAFAIVSLGVRSMAEGPDLFRPHVGNKFSTKNRDSSQKGCANKHKGGWWFFDLPPNEYNCILSFLNGAYDKQANDKDKPEGILWHSLKNTKPYIRMAIRPIG